MNSCILMAQIVQAPELRYTQDNQRPVAQMLVEFPASRDTDPPNRIKVVGWGNLATEIQEQYQVGDRIIIQGNLRMNTIDRPDGLKEKRAELSASQIFKQDGAFVASGSDRPSNVVSMENYSRPLNSPPLPSPAPVAPPAPLPNSEPQPLSNDDLDDIPF
ncbi:single-stranded DNA-binding protein [Spirulina major]|uniref:single-stranded DNA-binding protein n=1 Tax=Spirulina major TaxID=270636 RepID=UPI000932B62D|nr:single-stranded DNA-binding protein [Spirulina major]